VSPNLSAVFNLLILCWYFTSWH